MRYLVMTQNVHSSVRYVSPPPGVCCLAAAPFPMKRPSKSECIFNALIGGTKLVPLVFPDEGVTIHAKCEFMNPSGSIKDRFASAVIGDAERRGLLRPDSIILECSSGNTGVALAMMGLRAATRSRSSYPKKPAASGCN